MDSIFARLSTRFTHISSTLLQFNHCSTGHEVELSYDEEGSAVLYAMMDVPAGSPLRISYGDYYLTNPSATFAKYGFIDESAPSTFCKMMDIIPSTELRNIGLSFSRMLFYKDTGEVSEVCIRVWHHVLYVSIQMYTQIYLNTQSSDSVAFIKFCTRRKSMMYYYTKSFQTNHQQKRRSFTQLALTVIRLPKVHIINNI